MPQQSFGKNICHRKKRKIAFIITKKKKLMPLNVSKYLMEILVYLDFTF